MSLGQKWKSGQLKEKKQEVDGGLKEHHMKMLTLNMLIIGCHIGLIMQQKVYLMSTY